MLERIRELAIPPAWKDVWICPYPMGHIQATGTDAAGRKQYRYHDRWRERRDREKFESMEDFARALPRLRERVAKDLDREDMPRERVLACATRLLDRGFFRIGSEDYAEENDTYGIATMGKRHVTVEGDVVTFDYESKGGKRRRAGLRRPEVAEVVTALKRRRGGGEELLAWRGGPPLGGRQVARRERVRQGGRGQRVLRQGLPHLERHRAGRRGAVGVRRGRRRLEDRTQARQDARDQGDGASYLGNTPAVCRASYIDPRVFDRFDGGLTIGGVLPELAEDTGAWPDVQARWRARCSTCSRGDRASDAVGPGARARGLAVAASAVSDPSGRPGSGAGGRASPGPAGRVGWSGAGGAGHLGTAGRVRTSRRALMPPRVSGRRRERNQRTWAIRP